MAEFYVAPGYTGATRDGSASRPWSSLENGPWSVIDAALAAEDVTVYHSARTAGGTDANQTTTTFLVNRRNDTSSHRITLDGMSRYNTDNATPVWVDYSGHSRFQITSNYPFTTANDSGGARRDYTTVRGFRFLCDGSGQLALLGNSSHLIFEDNYLRHTGTPTNGPGINVASYGGRTIANVIIRRCVVDRSQGEGIYVSGWYELGGTHVNDVLGDGLLIEDCEVIDSGYNSGEADAIDVKDGWRNVIIRHCRTYQKTLPKGRIGITSESGGIIERNFVYGFGTQIGLLAYYNSTVGRTDSIVRNNVLIDGGNVNDDLSAAIAITAARDIAYRFQNPKILCNTIWKHADNGVLVRDDAPGIATGVVVHGNAFDEVAGCGLMSQSPGRIAAHSYNSYRSSSGGNVAQDGSSTYTAANVATWEPTAKAGASQFVSTGTPYLPDNFCLQSGSPLIDAVGVSIPGVNDDFNGATRSTPTDIGAFESGSTAPPPPPPPEPVPTPTPTPSPAISDVQVLQPKPGKLAVSWLTNVPSSSYVRYGLVDPPNQATPIATNLVTQHFIQISVQRKKTYYYQVGGADSSGNVVDSPINSITTK